MLLSERCQNAFSTRIRSRGESYAWSNRVHVVERWHSGVSGFVDGSQTYEVRVEADDDADDLRVSCSCPHFAEGNNCKHLWALLLTLDESPPKIPGNGRLGLIDSLDEDWDDDDDDDWDDLPPTEQRRSSAGWRDRVNALATVGREHWSGARKGQREAWFVLDFSESHRHGDVVIALYQRERTANGEFGKLKPLKFSPSSLDEFPDELDRTLLQRLYVSQIPDHSVSVPRGGHYYGRSSEVDIVALQHPIENDVLRELCASPRFFWLMRTDQDVETDGKTLVVDDGPPWRFRITIENDDEPLGYLANAEFVRESDGCEQSLPMQDVVLTTSGGTLMTEGTLFTHDDAVHFLWIDLFREQGVQRWSRKDAAAFVEQLWRLSAVPECRLPDELNWEARVGSPQPVLRVMESEISHRGETFVGVILFRYGDRDVPYAQPCSGFPDAEAKQVELRDLSAEEQQLAVLRTLDVAPYSAEFGYRVGESDQRDFAFHARNLPEITRRLTEAGWVVEIKGRQVRSTGAIAFNVTSSVDWFELDAEIDFGGVAASLPALLQAVRSGEKFVRLDDGSQGMIPEVWQQRYARFAELGEAGADGKLRFRNVQALLLDGLLAEQDAVQVDRKFAALRRKLKSFSGVASAKQPRGFRGELRGYQRDGLGWIKFLQGIGFAGCLADDMGLGKTVQVLALLQSRRVRGDKAAEPHRPSLIVVPKSLVFNWVDEATRFTPNLRVLNYTGRERADVLSEIPECDVLLTTYGTLREDILILKDLQFDYAVLDESQAIKNASTLAAKACRLIQSRYRLAMTGTPIENHLGELWSLFEFLNPGMLGRAKAFQAAAKRNGEDGVALQALSRGIAPFLLRRTKDQVLAELPQKTEQTLFCELVGKQRKHYDQLRDYYRAQLADRIREQGLKKSKIHVLEALLRLRQAACHPGLVDVGQKRARSAKLDLLLAQLDEVLDEGHKTLVFSQFTSLLAILKDKLDKKNVGYEYLDGKTSNRKRPVERFQNDDACRLFLISLKAGGQGLNLTAADYVYILDPWWNPAVEAQAIDRAHRIGQTRPVFAYRLIARDTVEEKILELQQRKRNLADAIITAGDSLLRNLTADDLQMLLS